jgi:hypothetical protein
MHQPVSGHINSMESSGFISMVKQQIDFYSWNGNHIYAEVAKGFFWQTPGSMAPYIAATIIFVAFGQRMGIAHKASVSMQFRLLFAIGAIPAVVCLFGCVQCEDNIFADAGCMIVCINVCVYVCVCVYVHVCVYVVCVCLCGVCRFGACVRVGGGGLCVCVSDACASVCMCVSDIFV